MTSAAALLGLAHAVPDCIVASEDVEKRVSDGSAVRVPPGWIEKLAGVQERRHAGPEQSSSDLAAAAGIAALEDAETQAEDVDLVIFASASHDVSEPATANIVHQKVGCTRASAFDVKNACNSFLNAIDVAGALLAQGRCQRVLVTAGEVLSPMIRWNIDDAKALGRHFAGFTLGDAGAAFLLGPAGADRRGLHHGVFDTDGSKWEASVVMSGGTVLRDDHSRMFLECDSRVLHDAALALVPRLVKRSLCEVGWRLDDVRWIVPHQVSRSVVEALAEVMDFPIERCVLTLPEFGNTGAASIPLALSLCRDRGVLEPGDKVLLIGGAAGFSAGVVPLVW